MKNTWHQDNTCSTSKTAGTSSCSGKTQWIRRKNKHICIFRKHRFIPQFPESIQTKSKQKSSVSKLPKTAQTHEISSAGETRSPVVPSRCVKSQKGRERRRGKRNKWWCQKLTSSVPLENKFSMIVVDLWGWCGFHPLGNIFAHTVSRTVLTLRYKQYYKFVIHIIKVPKLLWDK